MKHKIGDELWYPINAAEASRAVVIQDKPIVIAKDGDKSFQLQERPDGLIEWHLMTSGQHVFVDSVEINSIVMSILKASNSISDKLRFLHEEDIGNTGFHNIHGEAIQQLDQFAHDAMMKQLRLNTNVFCAASEEHDHELPINNSGQYVVIFDPLDGSSNIDVNSSVGTIFSIYAKCSDKLSECCTQTYDKILLAGYVIYGSSTVAVIAHNNTVKSYVLSNNGWQYQKDLHMPTDGTIYSVNEGNHKNWHGHTLKFVESLRDSMSLRYVGTLVADFHRTLLKGGIFLYPASPKPKLRLMYEVYPMSYIAEHSGGLATDENGSDIKDIIPTILHQKVSFMVGSKSIIDTLKVHNTFQS